MILENIVTKNKITIKKKIFIGLGIIAFIMGVTNPGRLPMDGGEMEGLARGTGQSISSYYNLLLFSTGRQITMIDNSHYINGQYTPKYTSFNIRYAGAFHNYFMLVKNNDTNNTDFQVISK